MNAQLGCFRILFACLFFIFPTLIFSQDEPIHLKRGRLYTTEGFEVEFLNLNQQGSKFTIENRRGKFTVYDQNEILRIDRKKGSEALAWGGYIGSVVLLESWLVITLNENINSLSPASGTKNKNKIIIGSAIIGSLVGLLIGSSKSKYKRIYDDPDLVFSPKKFRFNLSALNNISSLTLSYQF